MLALIASETSVCASFAVVLSAMGTYNVISPTSVYECFPACLLAVEEVDDCYN